MVIDRFFSYINKLRFHKYYFLSPHAYLVGCTALEIYYGMIQAERQGRKIILLSVLDLPSLMKYKFPNRALLALHSDYIVQLPRYVEMFLMTLLTMFYLPTRLLFLFLRVRLGIPVPESYSYPRIGTAEICAPAYRGDGFSWETVEALDWEQSYLRKRQVWLGEDESIMCRELLKRMGIGDSEWFVCMHVRESGYRKDAGRREHRNSDIYNYIPAIEFITEQGGWVFRMGDDTMRPLPQMDHVIDFPFSPYYDKLMEVWLVLNCRFFVATQSGIYDLAKLANRKILITNMVTWLACWPSHEYERGIFKHVYSNAAQRYLSISEILGGDPDHREFALTGMSVSSNSLFPDSQSYAYHENSPDEIKEAVAEYLAMIEKGDFVKTSLQKKADQQRLLQAYSILKDNRLVANDVFDDEEEVALKYLIASHAYGLGTLSRGFLEKNWTRDYRN